MKIMVNGTMKELKAIDANGVEWTRDLLGNFGSLEYDEDLGEYIMDCDSFKWWSSMVDALNRAVELENNLDDETLTAYRTENFDYVDLETETYARLAWLYKAMSANARK